MCIWLGIVGMDPISIGFGGMLYCVPVLVCTVT
jgi:hypothetical protein